MGSCHSNLRSKMTTYVKYRYMQHMQLDNVINNEDNPFVDIGVI